MSERKPVSLRRLIRNVASTIDPRPTTRLERRLKSKGWAIRRYNNIFEYPGPVYLIHKTGDPGYYELHPCRFDASRFRVTAQIRGQNIADRQRLVEETTYKSALQEVLIDIEKHQIPV